MANSQLRRRHIAIAVVVLSTLVASFTPALTDDLSDFNAAVEDAASHNRVALGYLRSENLDLAMLELERLRASWGALNERFGAKPPDALRENPRYTETLIDVPMRAVAADLMLQMGRFDLARNSLQAIRVSLSTMRRDSGIEVLADCVLEFNATMAMLLGYDDAPPDWTRTEMPSELSTRAEAVEKVARRCDARAPESVRSNAEFRRLIDGTSASLAFIPKVIETRDNDLLHRVLGELRAFDNLLAFRYG